MAGLDPGSAEHTDRDHFGVNFLDKRPSKLLYPTALK